MERADFGMSANSASEEGNEWAKGQDLQSDFLDPNLS